MLKINALQIGAKALQTRQQYLNIGANVPVCPYVLAEAMGLDLRFVAIASFEGMYVQSEGLILISAERPEGRKRFTCAHELGHHVLGHGTVIDEIVENGSDKEQEKEADHFAGMLLMPKLAVQRCLSLYGKSASTLTHSDIYVLSNYFGVSYDGFLIHLRYTLGLLEESKFSQLKIKKLREIRAGLLGGPTASQVLVAGPWWESRAIELEVGDYVLSESRLTLDGPQIVEQHESTSSVWHAVSPGITRIEDDHGWSSFIKISKAKFAGMFQYKYEEDADDY